MSALSRRNFLAGSAAIAAGLATAGPFSGFVAAAGGRPRSSHLPYGPLVPTPDLRDGVVRLDLPAGFQYRSFHPRGTVLPDGSVLPGNHDGMAAFASRRGTTLLVRNHEINGPGPVLGIDGPVYDPMTQGGTVTVEVDGEGNVLDAWVSLRGTQMNCAGGRTPWGSWLSCEETVNGDDVGPDFTLAPNTGLRKHGYVFEVPTSRRFSNAQPIRAAGRFAHEAAVVTPDGSQMYMTEDNFNFASGFYRYLPPQPGAKVRRIHDGGRLEMLKVAGTTRADLSGPVPVGSTFPVEWVTIDDPDPTFAPGTTNDQAIVAVGDQGRAKGAAIFSRLEGAYYDDGVIWFVSTQGGAPVTAPPPSGFGDGRGQVWAYDIASATLRLVYESPSAAVLDLPDNIVLSPRGGLVLCEDGGGDNFVRGLTPDGALFDFARNADPTNSGQEFAGATFSPDGQTLYVNIQSSPPRTAYSIAIWGPWASGPF